MKVTVKVKEKKIKDDPIGRLRKMQDMTLSWGFYDDAPTYPDGMTVASVAMLNEEGHDVNTPARPFMSTQADEAKPKLRVMIKKYYRALTKGTITAKERLEMVGEAMVEDLKEEIIAWSNPSNMQSTIDRKGFDDPLIESGLMYDNVDYKITTSKGRK
jgi:hypothetical protein